MKRVHLRQAYAVRTELRIFVTASLKEFSYKRFSTTTERVRYLNDHNKFSPKGILGDFQWVKD